MRSAFWRGKTAIVCGATSGLGRSVAEALADQGIAKLGLLARGQEALERMAGDLGSRFPALAIVPSAVDLTVRPSIERFAAAFPPISSGAESAEKLFAADRNIDLVVQAVGQSDRGRIDSLPADRLRSLFEANVVSSLHALQVFAPRMVDGGTIVLIGSLASLFATRYLGGYAIAKHGLAALAHQARRELAQRGIHVLLVCPGPIQRSDAGRRYEKLEHATDLPLEALGPGGGAKLSGLEPGRLARDILGAAARKQFVLIRPRKARWLWILSTICPPLAERILQSRSA